MTNGKQQLQQVQQVHQFQVLVKFFVKFSAESTSSPKVVSECLRAWFGSVEECEVTLKALGADGLTDQLGRLLIPFQLILSCTSPILWLCVDMAVSYYASDSVSSAKHWLIASIGYWLGSTPTTAAWLFWVARKCWKPKHPCVDRSGVQSGLRDLVCVNVHNLPQPQSPTVHGCFCPTICIHVCSSHHPIFCQALDLFARYYNYNMLGLDFHTRQFQNTMTQFAPQFQHP